MTTARKFTAADERVLAQARQWLQRDPDHADQLADLLGQVDRSPGAVEESHPEDPATDPDPQLDPLAQLHSMFGSRLRFGTAGLRAAEGPGPARLNRTVVRRTAAGLADFALANLPDGAVPTVVIGYDARTGSSGFAHDSAAVFTAAGFRTLLMPQPAPTPLLAFALKHLNTDVGVMVTASHNPAADNGYKVYLGARLVPNDPLGAGAQIVEPADAEIATFIDARFDTAEADPGHEPALAVEGWQVLDEAIFDHYCHAVVNFVDQLPRLEQDSITGPQRLQQRRRLSMVYTAMHGVGARTFFQLMERAGFSPVTPVTEQLDPDPAFPTVAFPNPEEPGAMDMAIGLAGTVPGTDLIIAHDPDADRLAVAVPERVGTAADGAAGAGTNDDVADAAVSEGDPATAGPTGWRILTGDEIGAILGAHLMPRLKQHGLTAGSSVVSGSQLHVLAAAEGVSSAQTLTGFKWISRIAQLGFGYEEAIGFCVAPDIVRDKDGLSAALVIADLAAQLKVYDKTLLDYLDMITAVTGPGLTEQVSLRSSDPAELAHIMTTVRATPPAELAGLPVVRVEDFLDESAAQRAGRAVTNLLVVRAEADGLSAWLKVRPSGTEPKVKCYLEVRGGPGTDPAVLEPLMVALEEQAVHLMQPEPGI